MQAPDPDRAKKTVCAVCHLKGGGCCRLGSDSAEHMFGLTLGEVEVIAKASNREPETFMKADRVSSRFLEDMAAIHPIFPQTLPQGRRLRLVVTEEGACVFLGPKGCTLPVDARPLYCRIYPFWFTPRGQVMVLISGKCLAQKDARSWRDVLTNMGETKGHLRELFARLEVLADEHQKISERERSEA